MSGRYTERYTEEQRDAIASAVLDRRMTYKRAVELAAAGELTNQDGAKIDPFEFKIGYVGTVVDRAKRRRLGTRTAVAQLEPRDAVEKLRRALLDVCAEEIAAIRKAKIGKRDPERIRQFGRAVRELQAIPGPNDPRRPAPGAKTNGEQHGGQTRGGLAGELLKANRSGSTAPDTKATETKAENTGAAERSAVDEARLNGHDGERPGSLTRDDAAMAV